MHLRFMPFTEIEMHPPFDAMMMGAPVLSMP
nr:hypothetical protein Q903MT_gene1597 [Picea sitchensis]